MDSRSSGKGRQKLTHQSMSENPSQGKLELKGDSRGHLVHSPATKQTSTLITVTIFLTQK